MPLCKGPRISRYNRRGLLISSCQQHFDPWQMFLVFQQVNSSDSSYGRVPFSNAHCHETYALTQAVPSYHFSSRVRLSFRRVSTNRACPKVSTSSLYNIKYWHTSKLSSYIPAAPEVFNAIGGSATKMTTNLQGARCEVAWQCIHEA